MSSSSMFSPLTAQEMETAVAVPADRASCGLVPIVPVPADAPDAGSFNHPRLGKPDRIWHYESPTGLVGCVARWDLTIDGHIRKEIRPLTFCEGDGGRRWATQSFPLPRPLYQLTEMLARLDAPVVVVEGEKAADAARALLPKCAVTTSPHGARAAASADWSPLRGRNVLVIPDADAPGRDYAEQVRRLVMDAGAADVWVIDAEALAGAVVRDGDLAFGARAAPPGWDLADAVEEGWTPAVLAEALERLAGGATRRDEPPSPGRDADHLPKEFDVDDSGVYRLREIEDDVDRQWICSRLDIVARTRDASGEEHGRLLRWVDADGLVHEWAMPNRLLAGDRTAIREHLLALGLTIPSTPAAKTGLNLYLATTQPQATARCVARIGWHEPAGSPVFVLPDGTVIGNAGTEKVVYQTVGARAHRFNVAGTAEDWSRSIGSRCAGNSRLLLAISAAFAGPLLYIVGAESGGLHLYGHSSKGKSTILAAAGSVWGGGGVRGFMQSWRATDNGLEGDAVAHCDTLLCLDELSECDPKAAAAAAYMLSNGRAKSRADRYGDGRPRGEWRLLFLSTGEVTLSERLAEDRPGRQARAGQDVRLLNVPIDAGQGHGAFEYLHGVARAAAFADALKDAARRCYGAAGRRFLDWVVDNRDRVRDAVEQQRAAFLAENCPGHADGQVVRAAQRFALIAAAGEIAREAGVVPWEPHEATTGVACCFDAWLRARGTPGAVEDANALAQVRRYFEQHGESRFTPWFGDSPDRPTINRAGFRRAQDDQTEWFVLPGAWKEEICRGLDASRVARLGLQAGWIAPDAAGSPTSSHRLPGVGPTRVYRVTSAVLQGSEPAAHRGPS